jgi:hypothetical protein
MLRFALHRHCDAYNTPDPAQHTAGQRAGFD